jgi:NADH-quinone oxidoreductase subunit G
MGLDLGPWTPEAVWEEIRAKVRGYNVALSQIAAGGAAPANPVNGRIPVEVHPDAICPARDTLFTSGSLGRYSRMLNAVLEKDRKLYQP